MLRYFLIATGFLSTALAVVGMFLPLVPTVPFLLLAAACFARSSTRFYAWLVNHRRLGPIVCTYLEGGGVPLRAKVITIALLWLSIGISLWVVDPLWLHVVLFSIAVGVTLYMLALPGEADEIAGESCKPDE